MARPEDATPGMGARLQRAREWRPEPVRLRAAPIIAAWFNGAVALFAAAAVLPGVDIGGIPGAVVAAGLIGVLNILFPPLVAALRIPFTAGLSFVVVLLLNAGVLLAAAELQPQALTIDGFAWALAAALATSALGLALEVITGTNDDTSYNLQVVRRVVRRTGTATRTDVPGVIFLEIDGLSLPVLRRALRDGNAPRLARWLADGSHRLIGWETDVSSQTGASQAGILLGANDDVPAFRWVERPSGRVVSCSAPADCAEIESRLSSGRGLLAGGGASRGNLFSGDADDVILTVSRVAAERRPNPGYRAFFSNGFNASRTLVLVLWEVVLEVTASLRARRRDVRPRGRRGGLYPLVRAAMCVGVRDLVVFAVLTDMMRGRPAAYATFASYDEVAHHSGLERADTLEALRKLDQQIGRLERARRHAPRPYEFVVLSDHGQTQGATFLQRNGYALDDLVRGALEHRPVLPLGAGDEHDSAVRRALREATGMSPDGRASGIDRDLAQRPAVVLGSGNLGLVYLMESDVRLTRERIDALHPRLLPTLRAHPHIGFVLVRDDDGGTLVLGGRGERHLERGVVVGEDPLAPFSGEPARLHGRLRRAGAFSNAPDILVNSYYDPDLDEACAFEELISFHGGLGGGQTQPFILAPAHLPIPPESIVGAEAVHDLLLGWRNMLQGSREGVPP